MRERLSFGAQVAAGERFVWQLRPWRLIAVEPAFRGRFPTPGCRRRSPAPAADERSQPSNGPDVPPRALNTMHCQADQNAALSHWALACFQCPDPPESGRAYGNTSVHEKEQRYLKSAQPSGSQVINASTYVRLCKPEVTGSIPVRSICHPCGFAGQAAASCSDPRAPDVPKRSRRAAMATLTSRRSLARTRYRPLQVIPLFGGNHDGSPGSASYKIATRRWNTRDGFRHRPGSCRAGGTTGIWLPNAERPRLWPAR